MSITEVKDQTDVVKSKGYVVELPVIVEADNVHMRYCACLERDGKPDRTIHGECSFDGSSLDSMETVKQSAIADLRRNIMEKLAQAQK